MCRSAATRYDFTRNLVTTAELADKRGGGGEDRPRGAGWTGRASFFQLSNQNRELEAAKAAAHAKREFRSNANELEVSLLEQLREGRARPEPPCPIRMMVHRQLFDTIIARDSVFGPLLAQIKNEYEVNLNPLESDSMKKLYDSSLLENDKLRENLAGAAKEVKHLHDEINTLSRENGRLRAALEQKSDQLEELTRTVMSANPHFVKQIKSSNRVKQLESDLGSAGGSEGGQNSPAGSSTRDLEAEIQVLRKKESMRLAEIGELKKRLARVDPTYDPMAGAEEDDDGETNEDNRRSKKALATLSIRNAFD